MAEPVGATLSLILSSLFNLYFGGNLVRTYGIQMPQRYINSRLAEAEQDALQMIRESLLEIANALEAEPSKKRPGDLTALVDLSEKRLEDLTTLTNALILRARAQFHVRTGRWRPESAEMLLAFWDEKPDLPPSSPNEAGSNADLTPQEQVEAILQDTSNAELLSNARNYRIAFNETRALMEDFFKLRHSEVRKKAEKQSRQTPERREIRARRKDVKSELAARRKRLGDVDKRMNPPKLLNQIARHIRDAYDLQIQTHAKALSTAFGESARILPESLATAEPLSTLAADDNLPKLFVEYYAVVHKRWDKAVLSRWDKSMLLSPNKLVSGYARLPRWTKMKKTGRSTGDGLTKIWLPTEIVKQAIDGLLGKYRGILAIKLINALTEELQKLQPKVVYLEKELMLQLDDAIQAIEARSKKLIVYNPPEDEIQAHQANRDLLDRMLKVFQQVRGMAHMRLARELVKRQ